MPDPIPDDVRKLAYARSLGLPQHQKLVENLIIGAVMQDRASRPASSPPEREGMVEEGSRRDYRALIAEAVAAVKALDDWTNLNETEFTGWGDGDVPPKAEWWRVKSGQALRALEEIVPTPLATPILDTPAKLKGEVAGDDYSAMVYSHPSDFTDRPASPEAIPEGMVMVPREPTLKMLNAGMDAIGGGLRSLSPAAAGVERVNEAIRYRAMLAAAPKKQEGTI